MLDLNNLQNKLSVQSKLGRFMILFKNLKTEKIEENRDVGKD